MENIIRELIIEKGLQESLNESDIVNIVEMAQTYYKRDNFNKEELISTLEDYCYQFDIN